MSRYIDADKLRSRIKEKTNPYGKPTLDYESAVKVLKMIDNEPAADVVEVVRCKDCVHWGGATYGFVCRKFSGIETKVCMGADHYCSYGERRTFDEDNEEHEADS